MNRLEMRRNKNNYSVNVYSGKRSKSSYSNVLIRDFRAIAQILMDLSMEGFPIDKAIIIYQERMNKKDWMGF